uniref:Uncharacterized protein n=1 Tax=Chromera velia CCMP2878 TaxID=1169474 RepID=A0A0G4HCG9_9ALVE|eukprot:Cvel_26074.t1-p1 / transcript=Cvel_26074.t1 / gene=Cvel_26074 / organism=Chromera_velia_CCMP2878 / gene_product=hypothetical protein / transcript_product=hypothetical protein / location=Cvel_scaffold3043:16728-20733(+) / protein_length=757 / sequence_SO=supercontig / SO=protein_coding / is_pseudo=false
MSQAFCTSQNSPPAEEDLCRDRSDSLERIDIVICSLIKHARPTAQEISELVSDKEGFGLALVLLGFVRTGRLLMPLASLDLSGFSLSARKLKLLLSSLPSGPGVVETLRCGPHVWEGACLPMLLDFLLRLKAGGMGGVPSICLKTLNLPKCDLDELMNPLFSLLPGSLEHLDLSGNRLRSVSMEGLGSAFSFGWLPNLLSLDLSDNPLGPSGLRAFARGLSSSPQSLPLQSLKLARTKAKAEEMEALAVALKAKKTTSLQTLDLAENEMRPEGVKHLASAVNAEAVPDLRVLMLKKNSLAHLASGERDDAPIAELLSTSALKELEELDLNENSLFDQRLGGGEGGEGEVVQASAAALAVPGRFPKLRLLDLGGGEVLVSGLSAVGSICDWFGGGGVAVSSRTRHPQIENRKDMTSDAFATLSRSLATGKAPLLQTLDREMLNENAEGGVEALAEGFRRGGLSSLTSFRLDIGGIFCDMGGMFCTKGYALSTLGLALGGGGCPALQKLDLEWVEEGDEGVGGLAEGLGRGGLSSLRDLSLRVTCNQDGEEEWGWEGCIALGEVLSTGKVPSLRNVRLAWCCDQSFVSLCEGLSRGSVDPPVTVDLDLGGVGGGENRNLGVTRFAEVIRAGKLSGLRDVQFVGYWPLSSAAGITLGEALTHADASLNSLEKLCIPIYILEGLARGPGRLPALHTLKSPPPLPPHQNAGCSDSVQPCEGRQGPFPQGADSELGGDWAGGDVSFCCCPQHFPCLRAATIGS